MRPRAPTRVPDIMADRTIRGKSLALTQAAFALISFVLLGLDRDVGARPGFDAARRARSSPLHSCDISPLRKSAPRREHPLHRYAIVEGEKGLHIIVRQAAAGGRKALHGHVRQAG